MPMTIAEFGLVGSLSGHTSTVSSLSANKEGLVATGSWDGTVRIWEPPSGKCLKVLDLKDGRVSKVGFLGQHSLVAATANCFSVWDIDKDQYLDRIECQRPELSIVDSRGIAVLGMQDGAVGIYSTGDYSKIKRFQVTSDRIESARLDDDCLIAAEGGVTWRISPSNGAVEWLSRGHSPKLLITHIAIDCGLGVVITSSYDCTARVVAIEDGKFIAVLRHDTPVHFIDVSRDKRWALTSEDGRITVWETRTWTPYKILKTGIASVLKAIFSTDLGCILAGDTVGNLWMWDYESGAHTNLQVSKESILDFLVLKDAEIVTAGYDPICHRWQKIK